MVDEEKDIIAFANWTPEGGQGEAESQPEVPEKDKATTEPSSENVAPVQPVQVQSGDSSKPELGNEEVLRVGHDVNGTRVNVSPLAKNLAQSLGVSMQDLAGKGSGPNGRVIMQDVEAVAQSKKTEAPAEPVKASPAPVQTKATPEPPKPVAQAPTLVDAVYEDLPLSGMRKTIAKRLTLSKTTIPHYYLTAEVEMDKLMSFRKTLNDSLDNKISVNDFVIKAAS